MLESRFVRSLALAILAAAHTSAQSAAPPPSTAPPPPAPTAPATPSSPGISTRSPASQPAANPRSQQPIFITGNVTLPDGTEPPERVLIERLCGASSRVRSEGYTDSKGRFGIQLGVSNQIVPDASESMITDGTQGFASNTRGTSGNPNPDPYSDCELRAKLAGYRSSTLLLAGRRAMDNPNVGTLVLYPISPSDGSSVSATIGTAPKAARKAYERALKAKKKLKFEEAEKELRKAVELHPRFADAWLELGKSYAGRQRTSEARRALLRAIEADPQYVYPYEELYKVAFEDGNWPELADATGKLVRLNPYEFPDAYYFHGVAQFQMRNWDAALKSLDQARAAEKNRHNPKIIYVMGLALVQKRDFSNAAEHLLEFAAMAPSDPTIPKVRRILQKIEELQQ